MTKRVLDDLPELMEKPNFAKVYNKLEQEFRIASALIEARNLAGMTQAEVAKKLGISQSSVARIESEKNEIHNSRDLE